MSAAASNGTILSTLPTSDVCVREEATPRGDVLFPPLFPFLFFSHTTHRTMTTGKTCQGSASFILMKKWAFPCNGSRGGRNWPEKEGRKRSAMELNRA